MDEKISPNAALKMFAAAYGSGINFFDTAANYRDSFSIIMPEKIDDMGVVSSRKAALCTTVCQKVFVKFLLQDKICSISANNRLHFF